MLYLRHAEKGYKNTSTNHTFCLDAGLTHLGKKQALDRFKQLIKEYPIPSLIICSPFLRCRQTAKILQQVILKQTKKYVKIRVNRNIGEYLGNQQNKADNIYDYMRLETVDHKPIGVETWKQYSHRIARFYQKQDLNANIWCITHGIVLQSIEFFYHDMQKGEDNYNFLDGIHVTQDKFIKI